jgi:hypothetical protein
MRQEDYRLLKIAGYQLFPPYLDKISKDRTPFKKFDPFYI